MRAGPKFCRRPRKRPGRWRRWAGGAAGACAGVLFPLGLLGASLLAGSVFPLATAYAVSETFGLAKGVSLDFRRAPQFYGLFTAMLVIGAALALIPNLPVIQWLIVVQIFNGFMLPIVLF